MELLVLTSPPASGKTFWIDSFVQVLNDESILVISPLRALADECKNKWEGRVKVMTPEEWLVKKITCSVTIFDEFHLYFYWGDSFRPLMWEVFYELCFHSHLTILLTATFSHEIQSEVRLFCTHFNAIFWVDHGNQKLKYFPLRYLVAPSKRWLLKQIENESRDGRVKLIFCQYRDEVFEMEKKLINLGFICHTCVGGEADKMVMKFLANPSPDFIISTTVLSHGVNLPSIKRIYFLYSVHQLDFWIQMVARGGRRGDSYDVFSLEKPYGLQWSKWKNDLSIFILSIKQDYSLRSLLNQLFISK